MIRKISNSQQSSHIFNWRENFWKSLVQRTIFLPDLNMGGKQKWAIMTLDLSVLSWNWKQWNWKSCLLRNMEKHNTHKRHFWTNSTSPLVLPMQLIQFYTFVEVDVQQDVGDWDGSQLVASRVLQPSFIAQKNSSLYSNRCFRTVTNL